MKRLIALTVLATCFGAVAAESKLEADWNNPPLDARVRAYWWWINGNVDKAAITRDLEQMKAKGFGGALICDADGSSQDGNARAPHGPTFFSPEWRELYKHTLREADRLGLEMSLNIQSGWNLGGPMVKPEDAPKKLSWSEKRIVGGTNVSLKLGDPTRRDNFYRDLFVLAWPVRPVAKERKPLQNQREKALLEPLKPFSAPDSTPLFQEFPATPGEDDARASDVVDLTKNLSPDGTLNWNAPAGEWQVIRFGFTLNDHCRVSTCSEGWDGYAIDPFDDGALTRYWDAVVEPLIADAGPLAGKALKYLHTDSWEVEVANWTPHLREEFQKRRGYDPLPWLPVIAGKIVNSRHEANRFLHDFRRTMGDLAIDHHFKLFKERAHEHGLQIHPESGGPHAVPIDAQQCLGFNDAPMSEFWAWSWKHRIGDENRFFVKQPASAAHTYGRKLVLAEGFTTIGPHWQETIWDNLKPSFDHALTEGLNLLVWHAFVCSPASEGIPGQQYFAGTHLNPNVTWWEKSKPFFDYINRCQAMLQQGIPVADVAYYYGDGVPNFARLRKSDPAKLGPGYDYDVVTEEVILNRMRVKDGKLVLPDGVSYRVLVLADRDVVSLPVLRKLDEFVGAGATIVGPKPKAATGLKGYPKSDAEVKKLADKLWDAGLISTKNVREVLAAKDVKPDFESDSAPLDYIHRRVGESEIYFVANRSTNAVSASCTFRLSSLAPELWNAITGEHRFAAAYTQADGRTTLPMDFSSCGSWFILFREPSSNHTATTNQNATSIGLLTELGGDWLVSFDPKWMRPWGGPSSVQFLPLEDWTQRSEPAIKFYSGTATYTKTFDMPKTFAMGARWGLSSTNLFLDLGNVREMAEIKLNGKSLGVVWCPPFRVNVSEALRLKDNKLEIEVVNFWPNRIIGDASLPKEQRLTRTNIRKLAKDTPLMPSGLLGPVRILEQR
ncbi:MAG: hypothetical protein RLY20_3498 [Verrucomicrobiota bacterium]|jgi:hypothetical protein